MSSKVIMVVSMIIGMIVFYIIQKRNFELNIPFIFALLIFIIITTGNIIYLLIQKDIFFNHRKKNILISWILVLIGWMLINVYHIFINFMLKQFDINIYFHIITFSTLGMGTFLMIYGLISLLINYYKLIIKTWNHEQPYAKFFERIKNEYYFYDMSER